MTLRILVAVESRLAVSGCGFAFQLSRKKLGLAFGLRIARLPAAKTPLKGSQVDLDVSHEHHGLVIQSRLVHPLRATALST